MTPQAQRERNRIQQEQFKTVTGRQVCFGARSRPRSSPLDIIGCQAPVCRGGYMHNGHWRHNMRAYR